jgi:hypothetical protein
LVQGAALNGNCLPTFAVVFHADDYHDIISIKIKVTHTHTYTYVCVCIYIYIYIYIITDYV